MKNWPWIAHFLLVIIASATKIAAFVYFFDLTFIQAAVLDCVIVNIFRTTGNVRKYFA